MKCKLCGGNESRVIYKGLIRNGGLGKYTDTDVSVYQCKNCGVIWHENLLEDIEDYYKSEAYRESLEGGSEAERFYMLHDKETLDKLSYTGTSLYRGKVVADIGCGCGAFLDFLSGVAKEIIAVEPSAAYRKVMTDKGYHTYPYAGEAIKEWKGNIDVLTSFDVIEHVDSPRNFMHEVYELLGGGGRAVIGTPTDAPVMRELLGEIYEKKLLFSTQHLWIFSERNLRMLAEEEGFSKIEIQYFQRYGIGNLLGWLRDKRPGADLTGSLVSQTMDGVWKGQCSDRGLADYIVLYVEK